jgi:glycosyltransferase involved in cell wall biosynthesis
MQFSVLIPIYSKENPCFLSLAFDSILLNQNIIPAEVIVVEDGLLTNELDAVIANYKNKYPQIKVCKLPQNMGMGYAMNVGLNKCSYEWVFRMDSDDIAKPTRFEEQIKIINTNTYDVIGATIEEFHYNIGDLRQLRVMPQHHNQIVKFMKFRNPINHMTVAFKKSVAVKANGYWDKRYFEDYNLWYEMYKIGAKFYNIQTPLVDARIGNNMVARRSGYAYYKYEKELMKKFLKDKFINLFEFSFYLSVKLVLRVLPVNVLTYIYQKVLRKSI